MSEEMAQYPSLCVGCARSLHGPVSYCPYCGTRHEAKSTSPKLEPTQPTPVTTPEPKPFVVKTTRQSETGKPKADTPLKAPPTQEIQRTAAQTDSSQGSPEHATVATPNPGNDHADIESLVSQPPPASSTTTTTDQASQEQATTQESAKREGRATTMKYRLGKDPRGGRSTPAAWLIFRAWR